MRGLCFRREVDENCAVLGKYAASSGNPLEADTFLLKMILDWSPSVSP